MATHYAIHILRDIDAPNPFEEWDSEPPILTVSSTYGGYRVGEYGLSGKCPDIPEEVVRKHWHRMVEFIYDRGAIEWGDLLQFAREEMHNRYYPLWQGLADAFAESVNDMNISGRLESLAEVYRWMGMPAYVGSTSGCSQGDYAEVLVVWTKEWMSKMGIDPTTLTPEQIEKDQRSTVDLFGAWAWGDTYGWAVTAYDPDDEGAPRPDDEADDGTPILLNNRGGYHDAEVFESCWGYYGADHKESGLLDDACEAIRYLTEQDHKEAQERAYWEARDVMTERE